MQNRTWFEMQENPLDGRAPSRPTEGACNFPEPPARFYGDIGK